MNKKFTQMFLKVCTSVTSLLILQCIIVVKAGRLGDVYEHDNEANPVIDIELPGEPPEDKPQYENRRYGDDEVKLDRFPMAQLQTEIFPEKFSQTQQMESYAFQNVPDEDAQSYEDTACGEEIKHQYSEEDLAFIDRMSNLLQALHDHTLVMAVDLTELNVGFLKSIGQLSPDNESQDKKNAWQANVRVKETKTKDERKTKVKSYINAKEEMHTCDNPYINELKQSSKENDNEEDYEPGTFTNSTVGGEYNVWESELRQLDAGKKTCQNNPSNDILNDMGKPKPTERLAQSYSSTYNYTDNKEAAQAPSRLTLSSPLVRLQETQDTTPPRMKVVETDFDDYYNEAKVEPEAVLEPIDNNVMKAKDNLVSNAAAEPLTQEERRPVEQISEHQPDHQPNSLGNVNEGLPVSTHDLWLEHMQQFKKLFDNIDPIPPRATAVEPAPSTMPPLLTLLSRSPTTGRFKPLITMKRSQAKHRGICSKQTKNNADYIRALSEVRLRYARQEQGLSNARGATSPNTAESPQLKEEGLSLESLIDNPTAFAHQTDRMLAELRKEAF